MPPIQLTGDAFALVCSPDGRKLYASCSRSNLVAVINTDTNTVEHYIPVRKGPLVLALSADAQKIYITNRSDGTIQQISLSENVVKMTKLIGKIPGLLFLSPDGDYIYILYSTSNYVGVVSIEEIQRGDSQPQKGHGELNRKGRTEPLPKLARIQTGAPKSNVFN